MATKIPRILRPQRPQGQGWDDDVPETPQKRIDARPSNVVYDPMTGPGTGKAARRIAIQNPNGSFTPVSGLGRPHNVTPKVPTADELMAQRNENFKRDVALGTAAGKIEKFNSLNPNLHMDAGGNIMPKSDAQIGGEKQGATGMSTATTSSNSSLAALGSTNTAGASPAGPPTSTSSGKGTFNAGSLPPHPTWSPAGQAASMVAANGSRTSAANDWYVPKAGTSNISSKYGSGFATYDDGPKQPAKFDNTAYLTPKPAPEKATPYQPQPSAVPADRLAQYAQAGQWFRDQDIAKAQSLANSPTGTIQTNKQQFGAPAATPAPASAPTSPKGTGTFASGVLPPPGTLHSTTPQTPTSATGINPAAKGPVIGATPPVAGNATLQANTRFGDTPESLRAAAAAEAQANKPGMQRVAGALGTAAANATTAAARGAAGAVNAAQQAAAMPGQMVSAPIAAAKAAGGAIGNAINQNVIQPVNRWLSGNLNPGPAQQAYQASQQGQSGPPLTATASMSGAPAAPSSVPSTPAAPSAPSAPDKGGDVGDAEEKKPDEEEEG